ncbi:VanZ family protein [Nitrosococcus watsonii]|uniref:VanZ family protein n=1 Tax=Nitrosococcus watsoni (strain C-113) TaxID=105559 RepID=D8K918_NITWC|nr:VanZ family protein [Nitrosococcus watsonii]ADJ27228.1 conserved hypothetical protein [Nitrosococcus watsonii C-113]
MKLKFIWFWRLLGWLLVAVVVYLSLTSSLPDVKLDIQDQDKLGHFTAYALLAWWFSQVYPARLHVFWGLFLVVLGITLEFLQDLVGRDFEYGDMLADIMGIVGGYLLARTPAGTALRRLECFWEARGAS